MDLPQLHRVAPTWNPREADGLRELTSVALLVLFVCFVVFA